MKTSCEERPDVLIVDDDEEIREIAAWALQQMGYRTGTAANAAEALTAIHRTKPRIVLADALMPRVDGRDLCRQIKRVRPELKVVIVTSLYTAARYRTEAFRTFGVVGYVKKPIDFGELRKLLRRLEA